MYPFKDSYNGFVDKKINYPQMEGRIVTNRTVFFILGVVATYLIF